MNMTRSLVVVIALQCFAILSLGLTSMERLTQGRIEERQALATRTLNYLESHAFSALSIERQEGAYTLIDAVILQHAPATSLLFRLTQDCEDGDTIRLNSTSHLICDSLNVWQSTEVHP